MWGESAGEQDKKMEERSTKNVWVLQVCEEHNQKRSFTKGKGELQYCA